MMTGDDFFGRSSLIPASKLYSLGKRYPMEGFLHGVSCFLLEARIFPFPLGDGVIMGKTPSFP
jgi:hypothetical protein